MTRVIEDLAGRAVFHKIAGVHDANPIAYRGDHRKVVGHVHHRDAELLPQFDEKTEDSRLRSHVESGSRLIQ